MMKLLAPLSVKSGTVWLKKVITLQGKERKTTVKLRQSKDLANIFITTQPAFNLCASVKVPEQKIPGLLNVKIKFFTG